MTEARITHIGGPTVLLEVAGWRLLTDPTFDPPGGSYRFPWARGGLQKLAGPATGTADICPINAVLLSHDHHGDNLDDAGRALLERADVVLTTAPGAKRLGGKARELRPWATTALEAQGLPRIEVTATPCRHGPPLSRPVAGTVIGFALRVEGEGKGVVWISGDTVLYPGVRQVADRLAVDVALLHLGKVQFPISGPLRYTMSAKDAVELCRSIQPQVAIPVHYEGWKHFQEGRDEVEREFAKAPADFRSRVRWLDPGVPTEVEVAAPTLV